MNRIDDQTLNAYIDGALGPEETARVAQAIAGDTSLQTRVEALRRADRLAADVFSDIDRRPMPEGVRDMLSRDAVADDDTASADGTQDHNVIPFPGLRQALRRPASLAAMAASLALVIGFGAGLLSAGGPAGGPERASLLQASAGSIGKGHPLHVALEEARSGALYEIDGASPVTVRPLLSFRGKDGGFCREILIGSGAEVAARSLACKQDSANWRIVAMAASEAGPSNGYAQASGESSAAIQAAIDSRIAGDPLDAAGEARAIARDWRP